MDIREVIFRIERERKEQNAIYHAAAAKFGLTDTELWVLYCISEPDEDRTQQDLCRQCFYPKQTINTAITGLAKDGLVELIPIPGTRNHKRIHLTPAGACGAYCSAVESGGGSRLRQILRRRASGLS